MATRREYPTDPTNWFRRISGSDRERALSGSRPLTETEAIMQLAPHEDAPTPSLLETIALKEAVGDAVAGLDDEDEWIFNALFIEQLSLRTAGRVLGIPKTSLARRRDYIRRQLMATLSESPAVVQWLREGLGLRAFQALAEHPHE